MAETKIVSKDTANRVIDKPADLAGTGYLPNGVPQAPNGAWGAYWGTPPQAMQTPNMQGPVGPISMVGNINLTERYTSGNVLRVRDGDYYKVVGEVGKVSNTKGLSKVKGRDGKTYYMKKLSSKEIKTLGKNATILPKWAQINKGREPVPITTQQPQQNPSATPSATAQQPPANIGFQQTDNWWTTDWWNRPGYYKRMY